MRAAIRQLPRGVFRFTDFLDNDGVTREPVRIEVAISIEGDNVKVDFHRIQRAGRRIGECQLRYRRLSYRLRVSLSAGGRCSLQAGLLAADPRNCAGRYGGECASAGGHGGGQCGDFSADHRRVVGALAQAAPSVFRRRPPAP